MIEVGIGGSGHGFASFALLSAQPMDGFVFLAGLQQLDHRVLSPLVVFARLHDIRKLLLAALGRNALVQRIQDLVVAFTDGVHLLHGLVERFRIGGEQLVARRNAEDLGVTLQLRRQFQLGRAIDDDVIGANLHQLEAIDADVGHGAEQHHDESEAQREPDSNLQIAKHGISRKTVIPLARVAALTGPDACSGTARAGSGHRGSAPAGRCREWSSRRYPECG